MNLTKRGQHALRTLIRIGVAQSLGREVLAVSEPAETARLPLKFVEQTCCSRGKTRPSSR